MRRGRAPGPRAAVRAAGAGQDHHRHDHRRRAGHAAADHQRPGHRAGRRPGRGAVHAEPGRGHVHRRDPPRGPARGGDAVPGHGGLPGRRHDRQGAGRHRDPAGHRPVHPGRRDHPGGPAARAAARPVRLHRAPGLLRAGGAGRDHPPVGGPARRGPATTTAPTRSPAGPAAPRGSPTGCCAGSATSPRSAATASSPGTRPGRRWSCTRWTRAAWTGWTGPCCRALVRRFGGGPVGLSTLAVAVGEEAETVEVVAEPFLVRAGLMTRTPRGRVATPAAWEHLGLPAPEPGGTAWPPVAAAPPGRHAVRLTRRPSAQVTGPSGRPARGLPAMSRLVAAWSRSLGGGRSLLVRRACAAKLRQLVS